MKKETENKKYTFHHYLWYMIIFSLIGVIIETIFGYVTTGAIESRKGLILGPLCPVYGCGAILIIALLDRYKGHKIKLLVYGTIVGAAIEYIISFILECLYGARFWDYSWATFNVNGRICLRYSIFWGILTLVLIEIIKKYVDKIIEKMQGKVIIDVIVTIILILDIILTIWGITVYQTRARETLNGKNYISNNTIIEKFQNTVFSNEIMSTIFPKLRIVDDDGSMIFIRDIFNK